MAGEKMPERKRDGAITYIVFVVGHGGKLDKSE